MSSSRASEDQFVQTLLAEGPGSQVLVESKMTRGSTHDKDRTTFTRLVPADDLNAGLEGLRDAQKADMADRRAFQPGEDDDD